MNYCYNMIIYDQWSYMTPLGSLDAVSIVLREEMQTDRLLFEKGREQQSILQKNCSLTVYLNGGTKPGFRFKYHDSSN
jgi:hypothetical protein